MSTPSTYDFSAAHVDTDSDSDSEQSDQSDPTCGDSEDEYDEKIDENTDSWNSLKQLFKRMSITQYSTAFSGIDSPGTAMNQLLLSLKVKLNRRRRRTLAQTTNKIARKKMKQSSHSHCHMGHLFAIEWEPHSQRELLQHPSSPRCLFGDISEFAAPIVKSQLDKFINNDQLQTVLLPLVVENNSNAVKT